RYRDDDEVERWRALDPISRLETYLTGEGTLTEQLRAEIADAAEQLAAATREAMNESPHLDPLELFEHVYATPRPSMAEQRAYLADELAASGSHVYPGGTTGTGTSGTGTTETG